MTITNKFWERLNEIYDENDIKTIQTGLNSDKRKVSFRINNIKSTTNEVLKELDNKGLCYKKIDFLEDAYILENGIEKDLWNLDIFKNGKIYLQSISSQIPVHFLDLKTGDNILDITAAPGSKTSQIASILKNSCSITANDNNAIRIDKLKFTLERQGVKNTKVIKHDASKLGQILEKNSFDKILADLPCSAEGRINLNKEKSYGFWSEKNIEKNKNLQLEILKDTIPLLKSGGTLVYSTCTIAPEENEEIINFILNTFKELEIQKIGLEYKNIRKGITHFMDKTYNKKVDNSIRCLPSEETEGFFIAKFKKI
ncbi:MAG: RsmB/NOP family class I SAM-dependent RNA methyltransferase [Candidatus Gracilibacteria bacterium]|nr:RsmB/NOP family class I SAM-dependent RNA methyltransferase [Candidatus Gracilibacteria bacterium]